MRWRSTFAAAGLLSETAKSVAAESAEQINRAAAEAVRQLDLQLELPHDPDLSGWQIQLPPELLWVAAAVGMAALVYALWDELPTWGFARRRWQGMPVGAADVAPQPPAEVMLAADDLARQGRFVDAMHVLLLQGLADIRQRLDEQFADSLTSREILRSTRLSESGRVSLRAIIARVEWSYFGEHPAAFADYAACREHFNALARALREDVPA